MLRCKFPPKFSFWGNLHNNLLFLKISTKNFLCYFHKYQFVKKFPQKNVLFKIFTTIYLKKKCQKKSICEKNSTAICFFGKFQYIYIYIYIFLFNCHKITLFLKNCHKNYFVDKFPQKYALLENFHKNTLCWTISKKMQCWKITTKISFPLLHPRPNTEKFQFSHWDKLFWQEKYKSYSIKKNFSKFINPKLLFFNTFFYLI